MNFFDSIKVSFSVLRANKVRSFLTSLGIIIGVASVIVIMSVGAGAQSLIINQFNSVGTNLIGILPGASDQNGPPASVLGITVTTLKYEDAVAIASQVTNVVAASSYNTGAGTIAYGNQNTNATYYGVMASYPMVEDTSVANGRFFTEDEERGVVRVAVLGYQVWQDLFFGDDPIGKNIRIKNESFEVIGVMTKRGSAAFQNQDEIVLIPVSTAQKIMLGVNYVNFIRVKVNSRDNLDQAVSDVRLLLRDRHNIKTDGADDFSVRNTKDAIDALLTITNALKFFLSAIAAISLVVGGVGVMNIMLAAVNERIREVGLRRAVGARRSAIMQQFIFETIAITLTGGIIGIIFGSAISLIVAVAARYLGYNWDLIITASSVLTGCIVSALVGLIFGIYPARKAAKLDPMTALRYE